MYHTHILKIDSADSDASLLELILKHYLLFFFLLQQFLMKNDAK